MDQLDKEVEEEEQHVSQSFSHGSGDCSLQPVQSSPLHEDQPMEVVEVIPTYSEVSACPQDHPIKARRQAIFWASILGFSESNSRLQLPKGRVGARRGGYALLVVLISVSFSVD